MSAYGKHPFQAGREHVRDLVADRARVGFVQRLLVRAERCGIQLTKVEQDFVVRVANEHNRTVPDIHAGDRNICDSLRRKYGSRIEVLTTDKH